MAGCRPARRRRARPDLAERDLAADPPCGRPRRGDRLPARPARARRAADPGPAADARVPDRRGSRPARSVPPDRRLDGHGRRHLHRRARWIIRWCGGPLLLALAAGDGGRAGKKSPRAGALAVVAAGAPGRLGDAGVAAGPRTGPAFVGSGRASGPGLSVCSSDILRRRLEPPVPQVIANSLMLGLEVGLGVLILAWLLRPDPGRRHTPTIGSRLVGRFALMPPLVQGVGLLATSPWGPSSSGR